MADQERIDRIVAAVRAIPEGFVRTYGDIAPLRPGGKKVDLAEARFPFPPGESPL